jgi:cobalt-zinc-cadmium efflux system membrane fusion protein
MRFLFLIRQDCTRLAACALLATLSIAGCTPGEQSPTGAESHTASATQFERGPHRGRMLRDGPFALELQVFEEGVPPEFHVYLFRDDKPLPPSAARVTVTLQRLDGEKNQFAFAPQGDFLHGDGTVHEPHSFTVEVTAQEGGRTHRWAFDSFEGRTIIAAATAAAAGIRTEAAGSATLTDTLILAGRLVPNAERTRNVAARFPGAIREVTRSVGDTVRAGDRLATIESNESLQNYAVTAPIGGVITERHANPGESTGSEPLFVITDYGSLWVELALFPRDLPRVKTGQLVAIKAVEGELSGTGRIVRVAPAEGPQHGTASGVYTARVALDNKDRRWAPGLFVEGRVQIGEAQVPLAVKRSALQSFRDFQVVFAQVGETYEVRMLELGRQDATWAEVLGGLKPGTRYVIENSYLIKADIEKSGASHDH